jgi:FO synthase
MEETISRMAGSTHGSLRTVEQMKQLASTAGRPGELRTALAQLAAPTARGT